MRKVLSSIFLGAGNDCEHESLEGSVMAPMVGAVFSYFHWSPCSAREYHMKVKKDVVHIFASVFYVFFSPVLNVGVHVQLS